MGYIGAGITRFNTADELTVTGDAQIDTTTLVVDSTNNRVGVGTASPSKELHVKGDIDIEGDTGGVAVLRFKAEETHGTVEGINIGSNFGGLAFKTNNNGTTAERMRIDNAGNVAFGTATTSAGQVTIQGDGNPRQLVITDDGAEKLQIYQIGNDATIEAGSAGSNSTNLIFKTSSSGTESEAARLDSSGNLLVGKTSEDATTVGSTMRPNGGIVSVRDGDTNLVLNRKTSDGTIVDLRKDGTAVGKIGTDSGDLTIYGDVGIRFSGDDVRPLNSSGSQADNAVDLGHHDVRWQDLYLSGGIYLGGTGSANHLDDYEEGTWTPVFQDGGGDTYTGSYAAQRGKYTKVGNMVTVWAQLNATNSLDTHGLTGGEGVQIHGLPFTSLNEDSNTPSHAGSAGNINGINFPSGYTQINPVVGRGITYMVLKLAGDNVSDASVTCSNFQSGEIFLCLNYRAT